MMTSTESPQQADAQAIDSTLREAIALHQAGQLEEAGQLYLSILQTHPNHPEANHNLGVLAVQAEQAEAGLPYLLTALEANPAHGQYWLSYIDALIHAEQYDTAREVLSLAQQQGLQGGEVDSLTAQLQEVEQHAEHPMQEQTKKNPELAQDSQQEIKTKAGKQKDPGQNEINTLLSLFNAGRLADAANLAQKMTTNYPRNEFAWMVLGVALNQMGRHEDSLISLQKATALSPNNPDTHINLGITLRAMGRLDEAVASYQQALKIKPGLAEAHYNLANVFKELNRQEEAKKSYLRAIKINPKYAEAHNNLGNIFRDQLLQVEAEASYRRALEIRPDYAPAHSNLGFILQKHGRLEEAEASCRRALQIEPNFADAYQNLGITLRDMKRMEEAEDCFRSALQIEPNFAEANNSLGAIISDMGRLNESESCYRRALLAKPDYAEAHNNLATNLRAQGRLAESEASSRQALRIKPDFAEGYGNLAMTLKEMGRLTEGELSARRALEIKPDSAEMHNNLGYFLLDLGLFNEAENHFRQALRINPDYFTAHSNLLFLLNNKAEIDPTYAFSEACQYGRNVTKKAIPFTQWATKTQPKLLRIGFVSGDFRRHSVGYFIANLLAQFDPTSVELIAYPTEPIVDDLTAKIKSHFAEWHPLYGLSDEAAARLIHNEGIHVLIDLSGHTRNNRLPVFAWKPAPVQASWLGYLNTTGVAAIDYLIADSWSLPDSEEIHFTEKILRLPESYLCFTPPDVDVTVSTLPALKNGYITFGSFNNLTKMNDQVVATWARILISVPESRLYLKTQQLLDSTVRQNTIERFAKHGIDAQRLILEGYAPQRSEHFSAYNQIDIALDPFPYPGITTSVESLWMGVPVLTLAGERFISRQGVSQLMNAGLPEWIASDIDDYIARAVFHSNDLQSLSALRNRLRQQVTASPIFDASRFARHFEAAMWTMWEQFCKRA